eukprot:6475457-Amphidinium_carterae.2
MSASGAQFKIRTGVSRRGLKFEGSSSSSSDMNAERTTKLRKLKEFLMQHEVDISIRMRVLKQVQDC